MSIRLSNVAVLIISAAFVLSPVSLFAQAPIVDASIDKPVQAADSPDADPASDSTAQSELFYQLQLLQQEVMQLRGLVEEQGFLLKQVKEQNMERYIDLDRRVGELSSSAPPSASGAVADNNSRVTIAPVLPGEKAAYDQAYSLVTSRRFDEALRTFKQFLVNFPDGKYAPNSHYWMGELYQVIQPQDLEGARQSFTVLLDQYPDHAKVPDAMYKLGKVYFLKGNRSKARELLDQVIANYSKGANSTAADKARQFINANF